MKVIVFNGSPNKEGNTYHGIKIVVEELKREEKIFTNLIR